MNLHLPRMSRNATRIVCNSRKTVNSTPLRPLTGNDVMSRYAPWHARMPVLRLMSELSHVFIIALVQVKFG